MTFNNQRELFEALVNGFAIQHKDWNHKNYIKIVDGNIENQNGINNLYDLSHYQNWSIYEEPKAEEKWYRVTAHYKKSDRPTNSSCLYKSKEDFLVNKTESDYHWIHLEEFKRDV
jgi:hypothetical protein